MAVNSVNFADILTYSRASTGTYTDANGIIQTAAIDEPRFNHELIDGVWVKRGLLLEESRTNLLTYSEQFDNAAWKKFGVTATPSSVIDPSGGTDAFLVESDGLNGGNRIEQTAAVTANTVYTVSVYMRLPDGATGTETVNLNLRAGSGGTAVEVVELIAVSEEWVKCVATINTGDNTFLAVRLYRELYSTTLLVLQTKAQLEKASTPSSYIPTTSAAVTRSADIISTIEPI